MKKIYTTLLAICGVYIVAAQAPEIEWQQSYGGSGEEDTKLIRQTSDGGYIIAGSSNSNDGDVTGNHGGSDCWVVKINGEGTIQWQRSYGGSLNEGVSDIQQTDDGGYIFASGSLSSDGDVTGSHGGYDCWIVKLDNGGNIQWQKALGGSGNDSPRSIRQTGSNEYVLLAQTNSTDGDVTGNSGGVKIWSVKLSANGTIQEQQLITGNSVRVYQTSDNGYVAIPTYNNKIIKYNASGNTQWEFSRTITEWDNETDVFFNSVQQTLDGGYIATGATYYVVKLNSNGNIQWETSLIDFNGDPEMSASYHVEPTAEGGYIVVGQRYEDNIGYEVDFYGQLFAIKIKNDGSIEWQKAVDGENYKWTYFIDQTNDGGYITAGTIQQDNGDYDIYTVKLASDYTYIPDTSFEQRLIDLGLDDVLDNFVLTSNISDVTTLDVSNRNISDLTGIEDFASLVTLNCSNNQLTELVFGNGGQPKNANVTDDFGLEYLNASENQLTELNVSGLTSLTTLLVNNNALTSLNVQNGNNINFDAFNATNNPALYCIQVDDADWSTTNWTNIDTQTSFNEDCANMSIADQQLSQLEIYPNPAKDVVYFSKPIDGQLFNAAGQKVLTFKSASSVNVSALPKGVYMLKTSEGTTKKLIVK